MNILLDITQYIYCKVFAGLSLIGDFVFATAGAVHSISLEDATLIEKHIGVFKKSRKVRTNFTRH